jgi:hypothetical protein
MNSIALQVVFILLMWWLLDIYLIDELKMVFIVVARPKFSKLFQVLSRTLAYNVDFMRFQVVSLHDAKVEALQVVFFECYTHYEG